MSYRRAGSFSTARPTTQSRSPRRIPDSRLGSVRRDSAILRASADRDSRTLGRTTSSSRISASTRSNASPRMRSRVIGVDPVKSSKSTTPSEYTSVRASTSGSVISACSGDM